MREREGGQAGERDTDGHLAVCLNFLFNDD